MAASSDTLSALKAGNRLELEMLQQMREGLPSLLDGLIAEAHKRNAAMEELEEDLNANKGTNVRIDTKTAQPIVATLQEVDHVFDDEILEIKSDIADSFNRYLAATKEAHAEYARSGGELDSICEDGALLVIASDLLKEVDTGDPNIAVRIREVVDKLEKAITTKSEKVLNSPPPRRSRDLAIRKAQYTYRKEQKALDSRVKRLEDIGKLVKDVLEMLKSNSAWAGQD
ncbi:hypothetical protein P171DRAFT_484899 [Karstenula rhodostoma CBS 690.94]|uniref:Uncharacterized protein n=1 Tax=Karstenula rhodostoma CBS 690.94 TaxID=1392251 RepID=A0A9P4PIY0_9PLEO|nr:hypothetical protein P171DRAFT_484899 [Karstenula rhodostoma CBS 690.94]